MHDNTTSVRYKSEWKDRRRHHPDRAEKLQNSAARASSPSAYFFLRGVSAGAYLISRAVERLGGPHQQGLTQVASVAALAAILPESAVLISHLGDSKHSHHSPRVRKSTTPRHLSHWLIALYGSHVAFDVVRQYLNRRKSPFENRARSRARSLMNNPTLMAVHDAAGVPLALLVASRREPAELHLKPDLV